MNTKKIAIIGGGISGLYLAYKLYKRGIDFDLYEKDDNLGGRIKSYEYKGEQFDLGPTWIWPTMHQLTSQFLEEFDIQVFKQYDQGNFLLQESLEKQPKVLSNSFNSVSSYRIEGGTQMMILKLKESLPKKNIHLSSELTQIRDLGDYKELIVNKDDSSSIHSYSKIVIAIPPRLLADTIKLPEFFLEEDIKKFSNVPTWMSSHAKGIALFKKPFWRKLGFSGQAFSYIGPLGEIHDLSPNSKEVGALFGFFNINHKIRVKYSEKLKEMIKEQLSHLFGKEYVDTYLEEIIIKDWTLDSNLSTNLDKNSSQQISPEGLDTSLYTKFLKKNYFFIGTEHSKRNGGVIEGALESVEVILDKL